MALICFKEFETLTRLFATERIIQYTSSTMFKYFNNSCPNFFNKVFVTNPNNNFQTRSRFQKLKCPFHKSNMGQNALSYTS